MPLAPAQATDASLLAASRRFASLAHAFSGDVNRDKDGPPPALAEILALLSEQAEWRVFVDGSANLGHQATTVTILRRMIELTGFAGRVVIVYADYGRAVLGNTAAKLALMFAGVTPGRLPESVAAYASCKDIRFLPFDRCAELSGAIAFGFTGGADDMSSNYAHLLNVRFFMRLQPYLWETPGPGGGAPYQESSRIEQPDGRHLCLLEAYAGLRRLPIRLPHTDAAADAATWRWYADLQAFDEGLACRTRNARATLNACSGVHPSAAQAPLLWPLYGFQHFRQTAAELLLACAVVALRCQRRAGRPVVLCSFSPQKELKRWTDLVAALASDACAGNTCLPALEDALARRHSRELAMGLLSPDRLHAWTQTLGTSLFERDARPSVLVHRGYDDSAGRWTDIGDQLDAAIGQAPRSTVHVLDLGPVAMDVFHQFMAHSELPPVIEGQASVNLMQCLGRPYLQLPRAGAAVPDGGPVSARGHAWEWRRDREAQGAARIAAALCDLRPRRWLQPDSSRKHQAYSDGIDGIAGFMLAQARRCGGIAIPCTLAGRQRPRNTPDKLSITLLALREVMLAGQDHTLTGAPECAPEPT